MTIVDEPGGQGAVDGLQLWSYQLETMEREIDAGSGYLGTQLDGVTGMPGSLPFSYLVAAWIAGAGTPAAEAAGAMMGDQPWSQAPSLLFPSGVLTLFLADALQAADADQAGAVRYGFLANSAPRGICSRLTGWVNDVLDFIFESLKVRTQGSWVRRWLGPIWNKALDLARGAVEGAITVVTAPVIALVKDGLLVIGVVVMIGPILRPWSLDVEPSAFSTRFAVGDEPDINESFVASVDTNIDFEWPETVVDCADVADLPLPDPMSAKGSKVTWVASGLLGEGKVTAKDDVIGTDNTATLRWVTGREESDEGDPFPGRFAVHVTVESRHARELDRMIAGLISGHIPDAGVLDPVIGKVISRLTRPVRKKLREMMTVSGGAGVDVIFHLPVSAGSGAGETTEARTVETSRFEPARFEPDVPLKVTYEYRQGGHVSKTVVVAWDGGNISKTFLGTDLDGFLDKPTDMRLVRGPDYTDGFCDIKRKQGCSQVGEERPDPRTSAFFPGGFGEIPRFTGLIPGFDVAATPEYAGHRCLFGTAVDEDFGEVELCIDDTTGAVLYVHTIARCADPGRTDRTCVELMAVRVQRPGPKDFRIPIR